MNEIIVSGSTGAGKTIVSEWICKNLQENGFKVCVSDHLLFANQSGFSKAIERVRDEHKNATADISILVVNKKESLRIEFSDHANYGLLELVFGNSNMAKH